MELLAMADEKEVGDMKNTTGVRKIPIAGEEEDEDDQKLHDSHSYGSSSKDDEDEWNTVKEKINGGPMKGEEEELTEVEDMRVEILRVKDETAPAAEEKNFLCELELPGHQNKLPPAAAPAPTLAGNELSTREYQQRQDEEGKKGFFGRMMDKMAGYHKN